MLTIVNPQFPEQGVLSYMLLAAGGIVAFLLAFALVFALATWLLRLVFIPKVRYQIERNGVDEFERAGFEVLRR